MLSDPLAGVKFHPCIYALCVHLPSPSTTPPPPSFLNSVSDTLCALMMATYLSSENIAGVISEWPINKNFCVCLTPLPPLVLLARLSDVCAHIEKELVKCNRILCSDLLTFFGKSLRSCLKLCKFERLTEQNQKLFVCMYI